jgi:hypothetical protein
VLIELASEQVKVSIAKKEWELSTEMAEKNGFATPTAYIRNLIRKDSKSKAA